MNTIGHIIAGEHITESSRTGDIYNPSTGEIIAKCAYAAENIIDKAVTAATSKSAKNWANASHSSRIAVIFKLRELMLAKVDELAEIIGREHGKTIEDAKGEIGRAIEGIEFACNEPHITKGEYSRNVAGNIDVYSIRVPIGVVGCITPFNFPIMVPAVMMTMAIAVGNAVIWKPSEKVPSAALFFADLWHQAGLPKGVFNIVQGDKVAVDAILKHPDIAAVSFVGSTQVGEYVYQTGTHYGKRVACFTGGKNHMIVMPDADLEAAASAFVSSAYGSASQRCMAVSLLLPVGDDTAKALRELVVEKIKALKVGAYNDPAADFGAVISKESQQNVLKAIDTAIQQGAELVIDGRDFVSSENKDGFYVAPTLFDKVTTDMDLYQYEIFGPVRGIIPTKDLAEAIAITNQHEYGNGAVIFTNDGNASNQFINQVEAGMIGINVPVPLPVSYFNFGGLRRSKFGESHLYGPDAARFYTKIKTVSQKWLASQSISAPMSLAFKIT